jgi:hypothetical protein
MPLRVTRTMRQAESVTTFASTSVVIREDRA